MNFTCCKDCPDRTVEPNCHNDCERYLKAVEEHKRVKDKRAEILSVDAYFTKASRAKRRS